MIQVEKFYFNVSWKKERSILFFPTIFLYINVAALMKEESQITNLLNCSKFTCWNFHWLMATFCYLPFPYVVHTWTWPLNVCWPNVEEFQITHLFNFSKYFTCWNFCYWQESFVTYYLSVVYVRDSHLVRNRTNPLDPPFEDQKQSSRDCNNRENAKSG